VRKLNERPEHWSKNIQTAFYEEFPFFIQYPISVNLTRKDLKRGFAVGNIHINERFAVPIIIDNFILKDFDVAMLDGKAIPLTRDSITDIFSNPSAFQTSPETRQDGKFNRLFTPSLRYPEDWGSEGRNGIRYTKTAMLQNVIPYITKDNQEKVASLLGPRDFASFKKNGTENMLKEFLNAEIDKDPDLKKIASDNLERDITFAYKTGRDKYRLYSMNRSVDLIDVQDINTEEYLSTEIKLAEAVERPESCEPKISLKRAELANNSSGIISDGSTHLKIDVSKVITENGNTEIEGIGPKLAHMKLEVGHVKNIEKVAENNYIIPKDFDFFEPVLEGRDNAPVDTSNRVIRDGVTGNFTFQGPVFNKYASLGKSTKNVDAETAFVTAAHCGSSADDMAKMAHLNRNTPLYFTNSDLSCPIPMDQFIEKMAKVSEQNKIDLSIIEDNVDPLIKIAAKIEDDFVVDKVLALGSVNEKSLKEFLNYIPALEEVASYLARLLILVRLGQKGIPEEEVEQSMESISKIILHLKNIQNVEKSTKELT